MPRVLRLVAALLGVALGTAACGGETTATRCTPQPTTSPPSAVAGPLTAGVDQAVMPSGGTLVATVKVAGPLAYQAPCDGPLRLIVVDSSDIHVDSLAPAAPKGTPCGAVNLASGQKAEYDVQWTADPTLPPGGYRLVLALGDQAQLALSVRIGLALGC
jgi:hypothetical protein